jgi:hypothetical protein
VGIPDPLGAADARQCGRTEVCREPSLAPVGDDVKIDNGESVSYPDANHGLLLPVGLF